MNTLSILCFLLIATAQSIICDPPTDINKATLSELTSLPYITPTTAQLIIAARPICSPLELTTPPKKIVGITANRLNKNWNWFEYQDCSETCCKADAFCESQFKTIQLDVSRPTYHFESSDWSICTSTCGVGTQVRDVQCSNSNGIVDNIYCATLNNKPIIKRICNANPCPIYEWIADHYGQCLSDSFGTCTQKRILKCYDTANNQLVDDSKCNTQSIVIPEDTRACNYCKDTRLSSGRSLLSVQTTQIGDITVTVDLLNEYNAETCNTDLYRDIPEDNILITRRACATKIYVSVDGLSSGSEIDGSWFYLDATLQADTNEGDNGVWGNTYLSYSSKDSTSGSVIIDIPNNGNIGEFLCNLYFQNNGNRLSRDKIADFTLYVLFNPYAVSDPVYMESILDRREYVENEFGLIWVGNADSNSATQWGYDQFYFPNLAISMDVLNRLSLEWRNNLVVMSRQISFAVQADICYGKWGTGPYTTANVNPWGGYQCDPIRRTCVEPWAWTSTTEMFDLYRDVLNSEYKVQFCQCWVYAAVFATVGRGLGIPTRVTSNFQSAHDHDFNRAIESYWVRNWDNTISSVRGTTKDSVWNFHVWDEMYFERDDFLFPTYNTRGWQAVDATPQELSYGGNPALPEGLGAYQMGPAAISIIRDNKNPNQCEDAADNKARFGCFDTEFVISETNANYNVWLKESRFQSKYTLFDSFLVDPWDAEYGTIGALTNTKKPGRSISSDCLNEAIGDCDDEYLDLTLFYKVNEPSDPGLPTNMTYHYESGDTRSRRRSRRLLWSENNYTIDDFDFEGIDYNIITIPNKEHRSPMIIADNADDIIDKYGNDYTFGMMTINIDSFQNNVLDVYCSLTVTAHDYSGKQLFLNNDELNDIIKSEIFNFQLNPGESSDECTLYLNYVDYSEYVNNRLRILDDAEIPHIFRFTGTGTIFDTTISDSDPYEMIIEQRDILVCSPRFKLRDRVICRHKLRWFQPTIDVDYQCQQDGISDGFCDQVNNYDGCYDGGDCCKETCIPTKQYKCPHFNCIDERVKSKNENFNKCPNISSFINFINELRESSVCNDAIRNIIQNGFNFECPKTGLVESQSGNQCIDQILAFKDKFGEIESCYKEAFDLLQDAIRPIVETVVDCINKQEQEQNILGTMAVATFERSDSGVDGTVMVNENGNVFIDLDVSELDISICNVNNNIKRGNNIALGYAIYTKWDYGKDDKSSKYGTDQCSFDMIGGVYNPFNMPQCDKKLDDYFKCSIGDLSGRLGVVKIGNNNKIVIGGIVSEDNDEKQGGFCVSKLTPESLYQRSIVFYCNDDKATNVLCAPFQIQKKYET